MPFVSSSESWQWQLDNRDALLGARVNADLLSVDDAGIRLARNGSRHISLITPPLELPSGSRRMTRGFTLYAAAAMRCPAREETQQIGRASGRARV